MQTLLSVQDSKQSWLKKCFRAETISIRLILSQIKLTMIRELGVSANYTSLNIIMSQLRIK
jgi:hypothetical protein